MRRRHHTKRLSIISDIIIFLILLPIILTILNFIDPTNLKGAVKNDEILLLTKENSSNILEKINSNIAYIKSTYGIDISYGKETEHLAETVSAVIIDNLNIVNNNIGKLKDAFKKYPIDFFDKLKSNKGKYSLSIILLDKFNNSNIALASRNNKNEYKIYLSNDYRFERAFHHEMYHIIEYYISNVTNNDNIFAYWDSLNPKGFTYDSNIEDLTQEYVYSEGKKLSDCYFITKYSKTSAKEDRAEIFAELMTCNTRPEYLNGDENIRIKVEYLCNVTNINIGLKGDNSYYWGRFIAY